MRCVFLLCIGLSIFASSELVAQELPVPPDQATDRALLLTAQSCVGEAGWTVDECLAIAWVYAKRAKELEVPYVQVVRTYSSALKEHSAQVRPWLHGLNLEGTYPQDWPAHLSWKRYRPHWLEIIAALTRFFAGLESNLYDADHYGSWIDARQERCRGWSRIEVPNTFRNWFFRTKDEGENEDSSEI